MTAQRCPQQWQSVETLHCVTPISFWSLSGSENLRK